MSYCWVPFSYLCGECDEVLHGDGVLEVERVSRLVHLDQRAHGIVHFALNERENEWSFDGEFK